MLTKGSYSGGHSPAARFLASSEPFAVMYDLIGKQLRYLHSYPGMPPAKDGGSLDTARAHAASISADIYSSSRMLFLDAGVPADQAPYQRLH